MPHRTAQPPRYELHPQLAADTHPVAAFALCELRLMDDANYPWLILVPRLPDARELIDLDQTQRHAAERRDRPRRARAARRVPAVQAQRRRARQPGAATARARDRALRTRSGMAVAGLGPGRGAPVHAGSCWSSGSRCCAKACSPERMRRTRVEDARRGRLAAAFRQRDRCGRQRARACAGAADRALRPPWLRDLVPAYASLALFVDADASIRTRSIRWRSRGAGCSDRRSMSTDARQLPGD